MSRQSERLYSSFNTESPPRYQRVNADEKNAKMDIHPVSGSPTVSYIKYFITITTLVVATVFVTIMVKNTTTSTDTFSDNSASSGKFGATESSPSMNGWVTTLVGTGSSGYNGDDIDGTSATLNYPVDMVIEVTTLGESGKVYNAIYIADTRNNRIRYMSNEKDTEIETFCGTGTAGYNGDEIKATEAEINAPEGVALDDDDNLYIADTGNQRIRVVDANNKKITTIAGTGSKGYSGDGGYATSATFWNPIGIAVDTSNNNDVYVADSLNNVIRRIYLENKEYMIDTFAGTGIEGYSGDNGPATSADFYHPRGIFFETFEATKYPHLYIADTLNHVIRKISRPTSPTEGTVTTFAGTGTGGYNGDGLLTTETDFYKPESIEVDSSGNYFISDTQNYRIRTFSYEDSIVYTYAGTGTMGTTVTTDAGESATSFSLGQPRGLCIDSYDNLIVADEYLNAVLEVEDITTSTPTIEPTNSSGKTKAPTGKRLRE